MIVQRAVRGASSSRMVRPKSPTAVDGGARPGRRPRTIFDMVDNLDMRVTGVALAVQSDIGSHLAQVSRRTDGPRWRPAARGDWSPAEEHAVRPVRGCTNRRGCSWPGSGQGATRAAQGDLAGRVPAAGGASPS